ncbi:serine hydrolase [Nocardia sp. SYP-A9097]|uniref:serine hydrolase domain-containing protein n=1 Tax=Nocardia sp. SYP-A9097 TaxID=2663237 RepID=UPI00189190CD|nr:serine hydrolase domain-containing protein [Nocardia sp. SYP-A9097]
MVCSSVIRRIGGACAVVLVLTTAVVGCGMERGHETRSLPADLVRKIDEIAESSMAAGLIPELQVAVIDPEAGTYVHAYGTADLATGRAASIHDSVRIGSVTKTFTATAVLRLADEGKLSLDDRLARYIDHIPYGDTITLRDLLDMRAGVWGLEENADFSEQLIRKTPATEWHEGDYVRAIIDNPDRATPPNTRTEYSNSNFYLLGLVLEKVTGKPVREVLDDLAGRYGLHETSYPADASMPEPAAHGYAYFDENPTDVTARTTPALFGAAGTMVSTISDLAAYTGMLGRGELLRPETFQDRIRVPDSATRADGGYGLGLAVGGSSRWHNGAVLGYTTHIGYLPKLKVTVAVVVNQYTIPPVTFAGLQASPIWSMIVRALYPGALGEDKDTNAPVPAVPSVDQLNTQLRQAFDPSVPAAQRTLHAQAEGKDPDLLGRMGSFLAKYRIMLEVNKVTRIGRSLFATAMSESPLAKTPMVVPLTAEDGQWRVESGWVCDYLGLVGDTSPACG